MSKMSRMATVATMATLVVVVLAGGVASATTLRAASGHAAVESHRGHRHHPVASGAVAIVFGMTAVLAYGGWRHNLTGGAGSLKSTGTALAQLGSGNGGTIAAAG